MRDQTDLFGAPEPQMPEGFRYRAGVISRAEEAALLASFVDLPFKEFEFQGYTGKRRVVSYGWRYEYDDRKLHKVAEIPDFLFGLRAAAADFAGVAPDALQYALVTEYSAGAAIGWHRDKAVYDDVIGISLAASCTFRLRRKIGELWERASIEAEPRSAYLMRGPSRTEWEHSIPPVDALRYSVTFRNLLQNVTP